MGREVRRVPPGWEHPTNEDGHYIPLHDHFSYSPEEVLEGLRDGWMVNDPPYYGVKVMPEWPEEEKTHYQMYEVTSEGTPISPVMASPEELARWLVDNHASAFGAMEAPYEAWLRVCRGGLAPSAVIIQGKFRSGVEG